jgi:hypothetical protein
MGTSCRQIVAHRHREVFRGVAAPIWDLECLWRSPPVRAQVARAEPHRRDLAATGPAGKGWTSAVLGIEPGGRGHWSRALNPHAWNSIVWITTVPGWCR